MRVNGTVGDPRHGALYRLVRGLTNAQLRTSLRQGDGARAQTLLYSVSCGAVSLGIITLMAMWTDMPLLFSPLAPSAFILFSTPLAPAGSPRNLILGHSLAVAIGLGLLHGANALWPEAGLLTPATLGSVRVGVIIATMATISAVMLLIRCQHPPAAASAVLAVMGLLDPMQALGLVTAATLLAVQATFMARVVAGLPYPLWRADARAVRCYGELAGLLPDHEDRWQKQRDIIQKTRTG